MTTPRSDETATNVNSSYRDARSSSLQRMVRRCRSIVGDVICDKLPNRAEAYCCWKLWLIVALVKCAVHEWVMERDWREGVEFWRSVYLKSPVQSASPKTQSRQAARSHIAGNATNRQPPQA